MNKITLRTGDVVFTTSEFKWNKPLSYIGLLIRFFTKCKYNHVSIIVLVWGKPFILESDIKGVVAIPYENWAKTQTITVKRLLDISGNRKEIAFRCFEPVGKAKYDFLSLLWFQLVYQLTGKFYGFTNERKAAKTFYCSEYVSWVLKFDNWQKNTPKALYNQMCEKVNIDIVVDKKAKEII